MFLHYVYRWRCAMGLFLLLAFGTAESAESGLFRRCQLRWRCCRPVVCAPTCCEPVCCVPEATETATASAAMEASCAGKFCPQAIVAEVVDMGGNCVQRTYRGQDCDDGTVYYTDRCLLNPPTSCAQCVGCAVLPNNPIPNPPAPPAPPERIRSYVSDELLKTGLRGGGQLKSGPKYVRHDAHVFELQLLDEQQKPIDGAQRLVELDWFKYREEGEQPSVGLGVEVTEGTAQALEISYVRVSKFVYSLLLKLEDEEQARHYVIVLRGDASKGK